MKYIVMECHFSYAILLDEQGRFYKAANRNYEVGQRVSDPVIINVIGAKRRGRRRSIRALVALLLVVLLIFGGAFCHFYVFDSASIVMSVNPDIKIVVNRAGNVTKIQALDKDAEVLIKGFDAKGRELESVVADLIRMLDEQGYLENGAHIRFTVNAWDDDDAERVAKELRFVLTYSIDKDSGVTVEIDDGEDLWSTTPQGDWREEDDDDDDDDD